MLESRTFPLLMICQIDRRARKRETIRMVEVLKVALVKPANNQKGYVAFTWSRWAKLRIYSEHTSHVYPRRTNSDDKEPFDETYCAMGM